MSNVALASVDVAAPSMITRYFNRAAAGRELAACLGRYADRPDVLVVGLPRGGLAVAYQVAAELRAPLDFLPVCKLSVPGNEELALGAVSECGGRVFNEDVIRCYDVDDEQIDEITARALRRLESRTALYRCQQPPLPLAGRIVILVDDGMATGATLRAALRELRQARPERIVVAVPVGDHDACAEIMDEADELVCPLQPRPFGAVGLWYERFAPLSDDEVCLLLRAARRSPSGVAPGPVGAAR